MASHTSQLRENAYQSMETEQEIVIGTRIHDKNIETLWSYFTKKFTMADDDNKTALKLHDKWMKY
jgi:hypothetical protein